MTTEADKPQPGPPLGAVACSAQAQRMRFLETLDLLSDSERRTLLRIETTDEIAALYTVAINDFGDDSAAAHTLASVLHMRIDQEKQNLPVSHAGEQQTTAPQ